ncbi:MAG: type IV toxin-antitoxin system AbiEi family antitoxin domain-containing protein [Syntrophales bacterium]
MNTIDILQVLPALFRSADLLKFTGNANVFLTRALARGYVTRLTRGVYANSRLKAEPSLEEAACFVRTPSYVSAEWALHKHGIITQVPTVCTVVTLSTAVGITRNLDWRGVAIEYSHISDRLYFGFEARDGFNLAMPEKALLDFIYYRNAAPFAGELELAGVDPKRLQEMAQSFPVRVQAMIGRLA